MTKIHPSIFTVGLAIEQVP